MRLAARLRPGRQFFVFANLLIAATLIGRIAALGVGGGLLGEAIQPKEARPFLGTPDYVSKDLQVGRIEARSTGTRGIRFFSSLTNSPIPGVDVLDQHGKQLGLSDEDGYWRATEPLGGEDALTVEAVGFAGRSMAPPSGEDVLEVFLGISKVACPQ